MKRNQVLKHLRRHGCVVSREGKKHTLIWNPVAQLGAALPRHNEIKDILVTIICRELDIPAPGKE
ncbi:MAG TPA: addiction module toxin, HicA family [candidate division Zixibacteria bacterium]|nr:addiction module toxin, HicA family [candidate division Zixibacteria bacterium]